MYYLIHTPHHPRPYISTVSFIANDFANWGCRVTCHANNSAYITEIRYQEKRNRPGSRRIELMEVWAKEVLARKSQQQQPPSRTDTLAARKARASAFAQDFVSGLSVFAYPRALVAKYTRLLHRCAYTSCATLPSWADPEIAIADQVALEFRFDASLGREQAGHPLLRGSIQMTPRDQLAAALNEAIGKARGRMGRVEKCKETGVTKVLMWVDVGDLMRRDKEEDEEPVPVYERGAWMWPPVYEECAVC
ncbi:hypothetical protein N0V91_008088 [Didymella pomorum]|uniref:Uncharacterized protein n=1 Tax=Didymella pomorum TaxID=749634 RepID=A0A9W8Z7W7_9PLEO|nr:hypothetical protein N0V91_008088 [Didymella pomorum]